MAQSTSDPTYENQEHCNNPSDSAANSTPNNQNDESDKEKNFAWIYCRSLTKYRQSGVTPPVVDPGSMDPRQPVDLTRASNSQSAADNISIGIRNQNAYFNLIGAHQDEQEFYSAIRRNRCCS